jgi:hypothetical protein
MWGKHLWLRKYGNEIKKHSLQLTKSIKNEDIIEGCLVLLILGLSIGEFILFSSGV